MRTFSTDVGIGASPERVWAVMRDVERWHEWTSTVRSIRLRRRSPLRVGSRAFVRQPRLLPAWWVVTDLQDGREFRWISRGPASPSWPVTVSTRHREAHARPCRCRFAGRSGGSLVGSCGA